MISRSRVSPEDCPPVAALTMSAPGATPRHVPFLLPMAPATHVGWMLVTTWPVTLQRWTTWPDRSPVLAALWYSSTPTRTPLPWSPLPVVQLAATVAPAEVIVSRHVPSSPRLSTSDRAARSSTDGAGRSTNTSGADVLA